MFQVVHHYLQTASRTMQSRLRKRGRMGKYSYIHTIRKQVGNQGGSHLTCPCRWEVR